MRHRHEVVLTTDAGHHATVIQRVRHRCTEQGHLHAGIEIARIATLFKQQTLVAAVKLIDPRHRHHREAACLFRRQLAQPAVKIVRAEIESTIQPAPVAFEQRLIGIGREASIGAGHHRNIVNHATPENAGLRERAKAVVDHFAGAMQAQPERLDAPVFAHQFRFGKFGLECIQYSTPFGVACVAQDQRVAKRISE